MDGPLNLRYELRAYEEANACRLAAILRELTVERPTVARDEVAARWAKRYPRHASQTGSKTIRRRIGNALSVLKVAGMVRVHDAAIVVIDSGRLKLAAENLAIVEDGQGMAVRPTLWSHRPAVPEHLLTVQGPLEQQRLAARAELQARI